MFLFILSTSFAADSKGGAKAELTYHLSPVFLTKLIKNVLVYRAIMILPYSSGQLHEIKKSD